MRIGIVPAVNPAWSLAAWASGCPVLTSDIRGVREQVGDAALLANPTSVEAIADGIHRLWTDRELGRTLSDLGRRRWAAYTPEDYLRFFWRAAAFAACVLGRPLGSLG